MFYHDLQRCTYLNFQFQILWIIIAEIVTHNTLQLNATILRKISAAARGTAIVCHSGQAMGHILQLDELSAFLLNGSRVQCV